MFNWQVRTSYIPELGTEFPPSVPNCYDLAKQLSHYLYFFSFLLFYLGLTIQEGVQESVMLQVSHSHGHMIGSHSITSHDVT